MRAKQRAERLLQELQSNVKNLETTLGRTSFFQSVENQLKKIGYLIEILQEIVDVEDDSMNNRY